MDFANMRFTKDHEWVRLGDDDEVTIGISEFAAGELGDIVYVELPAEGDDVQAGKSMGTIEAVKTVVDLYAPVSGTVSAVNTSLDANPEQVNDSPYENGWFVRIRLSDTAEFENLMSHDAYEDMTGKA